MVVAGVDERAGAALARTAPFRDLWPYTPRFLEVDGGALHYVDEGPRDAPVLVCAHGNPTWSFFFRSLIEGLRSRWRVIAVDHMGCGLSDRPREWRYDLEGHARNLTTLLEALDLSRVTLVLHDWGGAIGLGCARRVPARIARIVAMNTGAFPGPMPLRIALARIPVLSRPFVQGLNLFALAAVTQAVARPLDPAAREGLLAPWGTWAEREAIWRFVRDIPTDASHPSWGELSATERALPDFADRPCLLLWGERDWCFTPEFRAGFRERWPDAREHVLMDAGHYLLEDAPGECTRALLRFLEETQG